jgi:hypothetical protein
MKKRKCDSCTKTYEAKTARSKYCSPTCRVRASRGAVVLSLQPPSQPEADPPKADAAGIAPAVARQLEAAKRLDTPLGQAALTLARRIDSSRDTGAAMASMTRELRATLADALQGVAQEGNRVDDLRARRLKRLSGA